MKLQKKMSWLLFYGPRCRSGSQCAYLQVRHESVHADLTRRLAHAITVLTEYSELHNHGIIAVNKYCAVVCSVWVRGCK